MARLLIADDQSAITEVLRTYAEQDGYEVDIAADGRTAWELFRTHSYDALLLDVMMPAMDGFTLSRKIRETSLVPILLITARGEDFDRIMGLDLGADDYIIKPFSPAEVMARLRAVLRRVEPPENEAPLLRGNLRIDASSFQATIDAQPIRLTKKEFDLLWLLASHPEQVFTRDQLLDTLWGWDYDGDARTVDTHIRRMRSKLSAFPADGWAIETVRGFGYRFSVV